jgi:hypothetical protein
VNCEFAIVCFFFLLKSKIVRPYKHEKCFAYVIMYAGVARPNCIGAALRFLENDAAPRAGPCSLAETHNFVLNSKLLCKCNICDSDFGSHGKNERLQAAPPSHVQRRQIKENYECRL